MSNVFGGGVGMGGSIGGDKSLSLSVWETIRLAWQDEDLQARLKFVLLIFAVYALGVHIPVPIPGLSSAQLADVFKNNPFFGLLNTFGGGAFKRLSIFSLGLNPYITSSIIMQIMYQVQPAWKEELKEGGEYARQAQNKRTKGLALILCVAQGFGFLTPFISSVPSLSFFWVKLMVIVFWTAGAFFVLWMGEQISERGIGNGVSLMIFAGIIISLPTTFSVVRDQVATGFASIYAVIFLIVAFIGMTWLVVLFTVAQRRIPMQQMKRVQGNRTIGGQTNYLPLSVNMVGVIPLIFAVSLIFLPGQVANYFPPTSWFHGALNSMALYLSPMSPGTQGIVACFVYTALIFFFTYFYTAIQFNVDDIADNLKRSQSFIPGIRPGKQTSDFLNDVISKITIVGAAFLSVIALMQFLLPKWAGLQQMNIIGGTTLLILVQVALETMRQIETNVFMKRYNS